MEGWSRGFDLPRFRPAYGRGSWQTPQQQVGKIDELNCALRVFLVNETVRPRVPYIHVGTLEHEEQPVALRAGKRRIGEYAFLGVERFVQEVLP